MEGSAIYKTKNISRLLRLFKKYCFNEVFNKKKIKEEKITKVLRKIISCKTRKIYIKKFQSIKEMIIEDAKTMCLKDSSIDTINDIIMFYPGLDAIIAYRVAHMLYLDDFKQTARTISEFAHRQTGIDIHPGATIGRKFAIDHGTGIVIGQTTIIGDNVMIYHGVTLGALSLHDNNFKRHPTIKDNVTIYANASVLGGNTIVGNNAILGINVVVTKSIKDNSIIKG